MSGVRTSIAIFRLVIASGGIGLEPLALWLPTGHHVLHTGGFRDTDLIAIYEYAHFDYDKVNVLLEPDNKLLVKVAAWLNTTGRPIHTEATFTVVYRYERDPQ